MRLNLAALTSRAEHAFQITVREYAEKAQEAFEDPVWGWQGVTRRRDGSTASSPRNLVDTGELKGSQQAPDFTGPMEVRISWDSDHAAATFLGAVYRKREYSLPARNLPLYVARTMNFPEVFMRHFTL